MPKPGNKTATGSFAFRVFSFGPVCGAPTWPAAPADWLERYGVSPALVETYVDRSTYTGKSLTAANWLRLGQSLGRGRTSPSKQARPKSAKDVWVWQGDAQARAGLQERRLPTVVPRSIFAHTDQDHWVQEELDGLDLGHVQMDRRFARMLPNRRISTW